METEKKEAAKNNIGRLCLKLKINPRPDHDGINKLKPADHHQEEEEEEVEDEDKELPFVCQVCNKRYKSGKALGGHKRMHNLPPKNNNNKNTVVLAKPNNKRKTDGEEQDEDEPVCPLCERSFPSMKSLFGHMRSHPDRGWRGIQPPSSYSWSSSVIKQGSSMITSDDYHMIDDDSPAATPKRQPRLLMPSFDSPGTPPPSSSDDHEGDLTKSLKDGNWSVTAKRGSGNSTGCCSSSSSATSNFVDLMDNRMKEAVIDLMLLSHQKPRSEFLAVLNRINKNKGKVEEKEEEGQEEEENSVEEDYTMKKIENKNKGKKRRKKMKLADLEEGGRKVITTSTSNKAKLPSRSSSNGGQYVCSVCKRSFPSYQELGGHSSSHNKTTTITKKKNVITDIHLSSSDDDDNDDSSLSTDETATTDHDKDDDDDDDDGDQISAQKGDSKIALDFDLNEFPSLED